MQPHFATEEFLSFFREHLTQIALPEGIRRNTLPLVRIYGLRIRMMQISHRHAEAEVTSRQTNESLLDGGQRR